MQRSVSKAAWPGGDRERARKFPTGLFRANREHRLTSAGACYVAVDPGDGAGGAQSGQRERPRQQWPEAGGAKPRAARRHLGSGGSTRFPRANLAGARASRDFVLSRL
jgi:hypothetical protein